MITYPPGEITPNQYRRLVEGKEPHISYVSHDGQVVFHLMGPLAPVAGVQPGVTITRDSIKGLIAPWITLDQAGANQDGVTYNDHVYQPAEIDMVIEAQGRTPDETRTVIRDWIASWDGGKQGELRVFTPEQGEWWASVRWIKAPMDALSRAQSNRQRFVWTARIDDAFWKSYDSVSSFAFQYETMLDTFDYSATSSLSPQLGTNWPLTYSGDANGYLYTNGRQARWADDTSGISNASRTVVAGPYKDFSTGTDSQVINMVFGTGTERTFQGSAANDIWGRMGRTVGGAWNGDGIRARIKRNEVILSRFNDYVETVMFRRNLIFAPHLGDKFTLICGYEGQPRLFKLMRNSTELLSHSESGTGSALGASYRGIGFGMYAGPALIGQATPANIRKISAGDNATVSQSGYLPLTNNGEVDSWPRYLLYGPGYFYLGNGPDNPDTVEFGPLLEGQVVLIETEPRRRSVVDLTPSTVPTSQVLKPFQQLIKNLVSFASNGNIPPLLQQFESVFGILPPQSNLYSYLNGRFTAPVPAKSPGVSPVTSSILVKIDDGNASSKVVAALTPRRRWPL